MKRKLFFACLIALSAFSSSTLWAKEEKPLDAFIRNVGETHKFTAINGIWQPNTQFDKKQMLENVERGQALTIDFGKVATLLQNKTTAIDLVVPGIDGGSYTLELARYDYFSNDFELHANGADGDKKVDYTPGLYYSGIVKGIPGSLVAFSFFNSEVYGVFSIPGEGNYVLVPNTMTGTGPGNINYILYNDNDIKFRELAPKCFMDELPEVTRQAQKPTTTLNNNVYFNSCVQVRCYELVDFTMYTKKGSNVTTSTNYVTAMFNAKATIYKNEGIPIVLKYLQINTVTDNYATLPTTASYIWLDTFGRRTQNAMHGCDQATLFTTKGGNMGGVAWLEAMCENYHSSNFFGPYAFCNLNNNTSTTINAFPAYSWEVEVATHEMGHNLGCEHTHACVWGPARNYAIDSCYTIDGSCIAPAGRPSSTVKGTIMSYCHLLSIGISFSNGFGLQPGDTVRHYINQQFSSTCGVTYHPGAAMISANRTMAANRECTDMNTGYTYYWKDNLTASTADDTLVLMIKKNGNNIGTLNTTGFTVKQSTLTAWASGAGQATAFPAGTVGAGASNTAMNRYWKISGAATPTSAVEVVYPFTVKDSADIDGGLSGAQPLTSVKMYKVDDTANASPASTFTGITAAQVHSYAYGTTASGNIWSMTRSADTCFAHMLMTNLNGGGTGYFPSGNVTAIADVNGAVTINIYPNPSDDKWLVSVSAGAQSELDMQLYAADGKVVITQKIQTGTTNTVVANDLPVGIYYYRIVGGSNTYTGSLMKK